MSRENHIQAIVEILAKLQKPSLNSGWKKLGLSHAQIGMLYFLSFHGSNSVKQAADYLGISKSAISQLTDPLEVKKLVARSNDAADRRVVRLELTEKGRKLIKELARHKLDGIRTASDNLSDKEVSQLYKLILKMADK